MSYKAKNSRDSPKSNAEENEIVNIAIANGSKSQHYEQRKSKCFDLGAAMAGSLRNEDVKRITSVQNKSLKNFAKTNELLGKFNDFSLSKYDVLQHMFLQHTRLLVDLKKDLTNVFLRIRRLKVKLQKQYPDAFEATFNLRQDLETRLEQEDANEPTYVSNPKDNTSTKDTNFEGKSAVELEECENITAAAGQRKFDSEADKIHEASGISNFNIHSATENFGENIFEDEQLGKKNNDSVTAMKIMGNNQDKNKCIDQTQHRTNNDIMHHEGIIGDANQEIKNSTETGIGCTKMIDRDTAEHQEVKGVTTELENKCSLVTDEDTKELPEGNEEHPVIKHGIEVQELLDNRCSQVIDDDTEGFSEGNNHHQLITGGIEVLESECVEMIDEESEGACGISDGSVEL